MGIEVVDRGDELIRVEPQALDILQQIRSSPIRSMS